MQSSREFTLGRLFPPANKNGGYRFRFFNRPCLITAFDCIDRCISRDKYKTIAQTIQVVMHLPIIIIGIISKYPGTPEEFKCIP